MPIGLLFGAAQGFLGYQSAKAQHSERAAQTAYSNTLAQERAKLNLKLQKESWERRAASVKEQYTENANEASRAYAESQAQFNEQMTQFAYQSQGMINQLAQVEGNMRARGTMAQGQSSRRAAQIMSVGEYGRQSTKLVQNIQSADRQLERNLKGIQQQWQKADQAAYSTLLSGMPMPQFVPQAPMPKFNTGLQIGNAILSGASTANSMMSHGLFSKESYRGGMIGDFLGYKRKP